jgi:hypothetical protein
MDQVTKARMILAVLFAAAVLVMRIWQIGAKD